MTRPQDFKINFPRPLGKVTVPTAIARFPKDVLPVPESWIESNYSAIQYSEMPYGGHFTAMEAPVPFADALIEFINKLRYAKAVKRSEI